MQFVPKLVITRIFPIVLIQFIPHNLFANKLIIFSDRYVVVTLISFRNIFDIKT